MARAVARLQGRCPGVPLDGGGYSGCRGGADCPVCEGRPGETCAPQAYTEADIRALVQTVKCLDPLRLLATLDHWAKEHGDQEAQVQEARQVAALAGRQAEAARAERDALREAARALFAALDAEDGSEPGVSYVSTCRALRALLPKEGA